MISRGVFFWKGCGEKSPQKTKGLTESMFYMESHLNFCLGVYLSMSINENHPSVLPKRQPQEEAFYHFCDGCVCVRGEANEGRSHENVMPLMGKRPEIHLSTASSRSEMIWGRGSGWDRVKTRSQKMDGLLRMPWIIFYICCSICQFSFICLRPLGGPLPCCICVCIYNAFYWCCTSAFAWPL